MVVGYGSIGKRHIENLSTFPNLQISVCTNRKYDSFLKKNKCTIFSSLDDCIKQKPDIAFVTNTTNLHVKTAIKLAYAGIPMFIEKPLSNSTKDVSLLLSIIKKKKLVTMMGCVMRFHPAIKKIKELISKNNIGYSHNNLNEEAPLSKFIHCNTCKSKMSFYKNKKKDKSYPKKPFITSTLQQEGIRKLKMNSILGYT